MAALIGGKNTELLEARQVNLSEAKRFLNRLDSGTEKFTFQTFDDEKKSKNADLTKILHGTLEQHAQELERLNSVGAGVFVTINQTDLRGRKAENIIAVRKFFVDTDGAPLAPILAASKAGGILPSCIVESSPGNYHAYWDADCELDRFTAIQTALIEKFGTDKSIKDLPRVMRLPGLYHLKREDGIYVNTCGPFQVRIIHPKGAQ